MRAQVDAAALRRARTERGLTQAELANILGVAGGERVSAWERGVNQPDVRLVPVLASALGVEPAALLGRPQSALRELRWTAGLTARELGAALHVSRNTYLRYESGERSIPRHALAVPRLAAALGVSEQVVTAALQRSSSTTLVDQVQQELTGSWTQERGDGGDLSGDGIPGLADKLNYLFATVPRAVNTSQLHTNETAAMALEKYGIGVTKTHLSHLRAGRRDNPSAKLLAGLARLFGVPIAYFFDEEREREVNQQLATGGDARHEGEDRFVGRSLSADLVPQQVRALFPRTDRAGTYTTRGSGRTCRIPELRVGRRSRSGYLVGPASGSDDVRYNDNPSLRRLRRAPTVSLLDGEGTDAGKSSWRHVVAMANWSAPRRRGCR